ncbi:MAG: tRNA-dihydrouridine synthase [Anaerolineales bacterium]|nr:tRNA-dihydrouridine synthase [Anaerolineales bacterium]
MPLPVFHVGDIPIYGDVILAPMDGYSDMPFRSLCRELGSAMSYTEFINAIDIVHRHPHVHERLDYLPQERPVVFQVFDNQPERLVEAALRLQARGPDIIDVNLGCSARCVSERGAGAGLLRAPAKIAEIFTRLTEALDVPVTAKMRLGWDEGTRNYLEVAHIVEDNGGVMIAVHGRTRAQGYGGEADWDAIAEIRQAVSIPVVGNGDVRCAVDIERMKAHTGCQAVMIGRAAVGNPWIFSHKERDQIPPEEVHRTMLAHLERSTAYYGRGRGLVLFRKYAARYLKPYGLPDETRRRLMTAETSDAFLVLLQGVWGLSKKNKPKE